MTSLMEIHLLEIVRGGVYVVMAICVLASFAAVTVPNIFRAALSLILVLIGTAGIFIALTADFLALVQILLYVGAVMTIVIFAIMLTQGIGDQHLEPRNKLGALAFFPIVLFFGVLCCVILKTPWVVREENLNLRVTALDLGKALMGPYAFPFEVISVVLIAIMVGAIVIAKRDKEAGK